MQVNVQCVVETRLKGRSCHVSEHMITHEVMQERRNASDLDAVGLRAVWRRSIMQKTQVLQCFRKLLGAVGVHVPRGDLGSQKFL